MATIEFKGFEEYSEKFKKLGKNTVGIIKYSIYPGAGVVKEAIQKNAPKDSGDLRKSVQLQKMETDETGFTYTKVIFDGYDSKGVPNSLKARALESGHSNREGKKVGKHAFIRKSVDSVKKEAISKMENALNKKLDEYMNK